MKKINIEDLKGIHIFDGCNDIAFNSISDNNCYCDLLEYDAENDIYKLTGDTVILTIYELEQAYKNDFGQDVKIIY